ncbi:hypothetical protein [Nonomuraea dietziae]|uniref:hypothetical protein n=1 Tax=Nonomuraea dietziae TaxID=65515 RepID=UPI0031CE4F05
MAILASLGRFVPVVVTILLAVCVGLLGTGSVRRMDLPVASSGDRGKRLPRANALDAMTFNLASLVGSGAAGSSRECGGAPQLGLWSCPRLLICSALPSR